MPAVAKRKPGRFWWHARPAPVRPVGGCQRVLDSSEVALDAARWLGGEGRDPGAVAERRAAALLRTNAGLLRDFGIEADVRRSEGSSVVALRTSTRVGALPLLSPVTGRPDFGLVVEPRFAWSGIGEVLSTTGFKVVPTLLPLPDLPQSDRRIPPWVLSSIVLDRIERLLSRMARRFAVAEADLAAPKGTVDWGEYAGRRLAVGRALEVPCRFPDLRDDESLRSAIHFVLREHRSALQAQRSGGLVVLRLLSLCEQLLSRVGGTQPRRPKNVQFEVWRRQPVSTRVFSEGLQAIEWTVEERGLAGLSELAGLSWRLDMETFFEAWVETLADQVARACGARVRAGRKEQTRAVLEWRPPWMGSQRALVPDVVVERSDCTLVIDAKYKAHVEELDAFGWRGLDAAIREHHRSDLLQVLAYSTLFDSPRVVACLVYPCRPETYASLRERDTLVTRAVVPAGGRQVELALASAPMGGDGEATVDVLVSMVRKPLQAA